MQGQFDSIERNLVLEPAWVRESIVVTATGVPTPQPQTSEATTVLSTVDLAAAYGLRQRFAADAGNRSCAGRADGAQLRCLSAAAVPSTARSFLTESTPAIWAIRLTSARFCHHGRRECGGLSRADSKPVWRRR